MALTSRTVVGAAVVGAIAILALYGAHAALFWHTTNDDAFITFRYSRFVALGRGPYFNAGEHVEGYTNPLLMLLMVPVVAFGGAEAALPAAKWVGAVSGAMGAAASFALAVLLLAPRLSRVMTVLGGCLAAGVVAASPSYAINSVSGLETPLFGVLLTAGVLLGALTAREQRWRGAGIAFAAAVLTRPEGVAVFAVWWCAAWIAARAAGTQRAMAPLLVRDAAIVAAVLVAHLAFRLAAYDGEWLPNTYYAKSGGFWAISAWHYVRSGIVTPLGGPIALVVAAIGWTLGRETLPSLLPAAAVAIAGAALPFATGIDWMLGERLLMPFLPLAAAVVAAGWMRAAERWTAKPALLALVLAMVPVLWMTQSDARRGLYDESAMRARGYRDGHAALAEWLCSGRAKTGDAIALMDIGIIGYRCIDQAIVDITGLTDRAIARSPGSFLEKEYDPAIVLDKKPRFIVIVLRQAGDPDGVPAPRGFSTWTSIEGRLWRHPEFTRWYRRPPEGEAADASWQAGLARKFGALRVFQHAHPGTFYLLTVFERRATPA